MKEKDNNEKKKHSLWPFYLIFGSIGVYGLFGWAKELGLIGVFIFGTMIYYIVKNAD